MANIPRYFIVEDGSLLHLTWQCHNKDWFLQSEEEKAFYYSLLLKYKDRYQIQVHSYCLMSSHPHLTVTCGKREWLSHFMQTVNSRFAITYNLKNGRRGQVVMDRFKSPRLETDEDMLRVMVYIDLNPVRAEMVAHPKDFKWSSFRYYAYGEPDELITPAPADIRLGENPLARQMAYRSLVEQELGHPIKQNISTVYFIGKDEWVRSKMAILKAEVKRRRLLWKQRFAQLFGGNQLAPS